MIGRSAVIEPRERTMVVYQEFRDAKDALQASFRTVIGFFDTKTRRFDAVARGNARKSRQSDHQSARLCGPFTRAAGGAIGQISREVSIAEGFFGSGTGVNIECDQFGHMNTMFYVRRQTEAGHFWQLLGMTSPASSHRARLCCQRLRMNYINELYEGDMVETLSVLREVSDRGARVEHRLYNVGTGALSAVSDTSLVCFDLSRKSTPWPTHVRTLLNTKWWPAPRLLMLELVRP